MKVEKILTKTGEIYGVEVLTKDFCKDKEEFFRSADGLTDLLIFHRHIELIELFRGNVYFFINLKPSTLIGHFEKVVEVVKRSPFSIQQA